MVPDEAGARPNLDHTEAKVFELIRDETPDHWVAFHHVGLPRHKDKPLAEIDFVIVGEPGIFCLEVKGGPPSCEAGVWYAGTRRLTESPFQQVGSAQAALRKKVETLHDLVFGYGCVFPDAEFSVDTPEVLPEIVYDATHGDSPFSTYIERLGEYWKGRYPWARSLDNAAISKAAATLRPDFSCVTSIMPAVRGAKRRLIELTAEQARALEGLSESAQVIVSGGAGTGKTLLAAEEAVRLNDAGARVLLTCFNKGLSQHLAAAPRLSRPGLDVCHLDGLTADLIEEGGTGSEIPPDVSDDELFELHRPLAAIKAIDSLGRTGCYDAVLVDEGQDLITQNRLDVIDALLAEGVGAGRWRVFWDPGQDLFHADLEADLGLLSEMGAEPSRYKLTVNCRNTVPIADRVEVLSDVRMGETAFAEGPEPVDAVWDGAKTHRKEFRRTLQRLLEQGMPVGSIKVLSPVRFERSVASEDLGIGVEVLDEPGRQPDPEAEGLSFATIQSFKGLEADAVILVDVDDLTSSRMRSLLYVGASRAKSYLAVLRSASTTDVFSDRIVHRGGTATGATAGVSADLL